MNDYITNVREICSQNEKEMIFFLRRIDKTQLSIERKFLSADVNINIAIAKYGIQK